MRVRTLLAFNVWNRQLASCSQLVLDLSVANVLPHITSAVLQEATAKISHFILSPGWRRRTSGGKRRGLV